MDNTSVTWAISKTFFAFHPILMKLGEVVVHQSTTTYQVSSKLDEKQGSFSNSPCNRFVIH